MLPHSLGAGYSWCVPVLPVRAPEPSQLGCGQSQDLNSVLLPTKALIS